MSKTGWLLKVVLLGMLVGLAAALSACSTQPTPTPTNTSIDLLSLLPQDGSVSGWDALTEPAVFDRDNLYNLVDGQADAFFAYGFQQVATRRYQNADGDFINVEIWQLADPADAYGLFHSGRAGQPAQIGVEGDSDPGRRLAFWQDRYFVSVSASADISDQTLWEFADQIVSSLPEGGIPPDIVNSLPGENQIDGSALFFHEEISIQNDLWLGGKNVLDLSQETDGVIARYDLNGESVRLILIEYPTSQQASDSLKALQASEIDEPLAADVQGSQLAAVFGDADLSLAQDLLSQTLK